MRLLPAYWYIVGLDTIHSISSGVKFFDFKGLPAPHLSAFAAGRPPEFQALAILLTWWEVRCSREATSRSVAEVLSRGGGTPPVREALMGAPARSEITCEGLGGWSFFFEVMGLAQF